jgi:endoglucanase
MRNPQLSAVGRGRRALLAGLGGAGLAAALPSQAKAAAVASDQVQWLEFRQRFITAEGRVVDTGNRNISHSEGQGYGLLLAEAFDDRPTFDKLLGWTRATLLRPEGLHAWRFRPGGVGVDDQNNATDGDLYIGWALLRAAQRWGRGTYGQMALTLGQAISERLVLPVQGRTLLLPGVRGFADGAKVLINPSYYAFPALQAFGQASGDAVWQRLADDGVKLLREARFGRWGLPADWVELPRGESAGPVMAAGRPPRFSYDAVRVPLHLAWAGMTEEPALDAATRFWSETNGTAPPAWTDLRTGQLGGELATSGMAAIAAVSAGSRRGRVNSQGLPKVAQARDYYAAALTLLARLAANEAPPPGMALPARAPRPPAVVASPEKPPIIAKPQAVSFGQGLVRSAASLLGAR